MTASNLRRASVVAALATTPFVLSGLTATASAETPISIDDAPETFTSAFVVDATPGAVIGPDNTTPAPGEAGTAGLFLFAINSDENIICYDIATEGVEPPYQSMAKTATHIHQTAAGTNGPPRIAFPNPQGTTDLRTSRGCLEGPFTTGLTANGQDTGTGFTLDQIEANPSGFSADTHTSAYVPGAVRGQLTADADLLEKANTIGFFADEDAEPTPAPSPTSDVDDADDARPTPVGGVRTGGGGSAADGSSGLVAAVALAGVTAAGALAVRRHRRG